MAANVVFWCAMVSINEPTLLPLTYGDQGHEMDWISNPETATLLTHDGNRADLAEFGVDLQTANVLHEVQRLSRLYTSAVEYGSPEEAVTVLSYLCSILERLLQMSKYFPNPTLMLHTLVRDLKASLTYTLRAIGTKSHLLLWLLSVGGITAHSMPERSWFVGHLVVVITDLGIGSWEAMRRHLVQFAFHDNFCDVSFNDLWEEVRLQQP
ncbi:hypothetical protein LTR36_005986 [Oleoguttula mirabilis]|uniref:Uncharacterized protein n=1 Tax=Oleoguttula mirabilis TaxID=1507867 RepID=A0AAV9JCY5_9PEZI|nr:hypothetical protein LTR36_005986 [Oleoguttula mirabilis]